MKKTLLIALAALTVLGLALIAGRLYLPRAAFHMLGKAVGGSVEASGSRVSFHDGLIVLALSGVRVQGRVAGTVQKCELRLRPSRGLYVAYLAISDFDIEVKDHKGGFSFFPVPVELAEIRNGTVRYGGKKYVLRELRVTDFNTGGRLEFSIDGGVEGLGNLKTKGEGIFGQKRSDIKGEYNLTSVNMARVFKNYQGLADSRGVFSYRDGRLVMDGVVDAPYFSIMEDFLTRRLVSLKNYCRIHLERVGETSDVTLTGLSFKGAPLFLKFSGDPRRLLSIDMSLGFLAIHDLLDYIDPALLSEGDWGPLSFIKGGDVCIKRFVFQRGRPLTARLEVREMEVGDGPVAFSGVRGELQLTDSALTLTGFEGRVGEGGVFGVSGLVPLRLDRDVRINGGFHLALRDLARLAGEERVRVLAGVTDGEVELTGRMGKGFSVRGAGSLKDCRLARGAVTLGAAGRYRFRDGEVSLDPVTFTGGGTKLVVSGQAEAEKADLSVKGVVEGAQLNLLSDGRYSCAGLMAVDGRIGIDDGAVRADGRLCMTDLSFEVPRVVRKSRGIESSAVVSLRVEKGGGDVLVDRLFCTLGPLAASLSGRIGRHRISGAHVAVNCPGVERVSKLFFFNRGGVRGDLKADLSVSDLPYPVTRLPRMRGYLTFERGSVHPPALTNALTDIELSCVFDGDRFTVDLAGLEAGGSRLGSGRLVVAGLEEPVFDLAVEMDRFDPADFAGSYGKRFVLPVIEAGSLMARTRGEFRLTSRSLRIRDVSWSGLALSGTMAQRALEVTSGRVATEKGEIVFRGSASFDSVPRIAVTGNFVDATAGEVIALFGGKPGIFEGTGTVAGTITLSGRDGASLGRSAAGTVSVVSRDGVIRRWNVLSKILALTNPYDLFRGRVDLTREGLVYKRLSASFEGRDGVFHTGDFLIDSPSMLITGFGDIDVVKGVDGHMTVSPLVTMDKILDLIPLVRHVLRERESGFIFFVYGIKGPARDPEVRSSYVHSVGARIVYLLRNTIELPKGLWDELHKELRK